MTPTKFVENCTAAAADLALLFAGADSDKVAASISKMRSNLEAKLPVEFAGTGFVDRFIEAICGHKAAIERGLPISGSGLN